MNMGDFSTWCEWLFDKSADFLNSFHFIRLDYFAASVLICVIVPLIIYGLLIWALIARKKKDKVLNVNNND